MTLTVRSLNPARDEAIETLFDRAFDREGRESALFRELAERPHPAFDPKLCLVAEEEGRAVGAALFLPRRQWIRGVPIATAACAPVGVLPDARGRGVGEQLLEEGAKRLRERGTRALVAIGAPAFFERNGFAPAFGFHTCHVPDELLEASGIEAAGDEWRGLRGEDLAQLPALSEACQDGTSGAELRTADVSEWESAAPQCWAMACESGGRTIAYLRFRRREELEVTEAAAADKEGVRAIVSMLRRLCAEHAAPRVEVHIAPQHPLARALFHLGCPIESSNFAGAAWLKVLQPAELLRDLAPVWRRPLFFVPGQPELSFDLAGTAIRLGLENGDPVVTKDRCEMNHAELPKGWIESLLTGQRGAEELRFEVSEKQLGRQADETL
ncbi:MAG: N-acetyltransferase, partial [Planctomycetota bacterium]